MSTLPKAIRLPALMPYHGSMHGQYLFLSWLSLAKLLLQEANIKGAISYAVLQEIKDPGSSNQGKHESSTLKYRPGVL